MEQRIRQRRALFTVLQNWLDETSVLQAIDIFEQRFQDRPTIAIHDYLREIAPLYKNKVDAKTLHRNLMQVLVQRAQELAPDPLPQLEKFRQQARTEITLQSSSQPSENQLALHQLISSMMRKVPIAQRKQLHVHIAQQLKSRFRNGSYDQLAHYMLAENPQYLVSFDDPSLRDFLSLIYVAACEVLGPVQADHWLGDSIQQIRQQNLPVSQAINRYL